ncbi:MAG: hypothetical protein JWR85_3870 [Marmoricola sp.]|nr:hypothetical protein [Marmoricola sp.]
MASTELIKRLARPLLVPATLAALALPFLLAALVVALVVGMGRRIARMRKDSRAHKPAIVWGSAPIKNNTFWSRSMKEAGFHSETFTTAYYASINDRADWDRLLEEEYRWLPSPLRKYAGFIDGLARYEVFVIPFTGFFIGDSALWRIQAPLMKLAAARIVALPYGADAYSYRHIRSTELIHGLMMSYPAAAREQRKVEARMEYWSDHAHVVIPGFMGPDGFGRWDVLIPSSVFVDLGAWKPSRRQSAADGVNGTVVIAHAPNHKGFKGSEFILAAVEALRAEGLKVELLLLERVKNSQVRAAFENQVDIHVEQLVAPGFGMNAIEGMASGLPVISNLENANYVQPFRRWSYFAECPVVSATPESVADVLRTLVTRPLLRHELGRASREYAEKYHGLDSSAHLFTAVIDYLYGRRESLVHLYHPLLGDYSRRRPRVEHPLIDNRIVS